MSLERRLNRLETAMREPPCIFLPAEPAALARLRWQLRPFLEGLGPGSGAGGLPILKASEDAVCTS